MEERDITTIGGFIKPFWFPFASVYVPVTPCVLDGSLSFLEMVWKLLKDLNKVVEAANANHTDILTIVTEIERIYGLIAEKLSYLEVNFTENDGTVTADKTLEEILAAYEDGIVLGRMTVSGNEYFYIALGHTVTGQRENVAFYALHGLTLDEIKVYDDSITHTTSTLITTAGGTFTGPVNVPSPTEDAHAATKKYVDDQDAATLVSAKNYADNNFVSNTGNAGSTYGTRSNTDRDFTDIPASPSTITINELLAKLGRWYVEIANKVSDVTISDTLPYTANKTFVDVYQLISEGQEVRCIYTGTGIRDKKVLRIENYGPGSMLFKNNDYELTWSSDETITVTSL